MAHYGRKEFMCVWPPGSVWQKTCQLTPLQNTADHGVGAQRPQSVTPTPAPYLKAPLKMNGSSVCCVAPGMSQGLENKHSELRRRKEATSIKSLPEPHWVWRGKCAGSSRRALLELPSHSRSGPLGVTVTPLALWPCAISSRSPAPSILCPQSQQPSLGSALGQRCLSQHVCAALSTEAA